MAAIGQRNRDATGAPSTAQDGTQTPKSTDAPSAAKARRGDSTQLGPKRLTPDQERLVQELAQTDQKVRAHEAAHQAAAGSLGGAVSYTFETGPDGKSYAVGGEVPVDMSSGRTPEETLSKAEQIRAAALAPADPSPQDLSVAAQASEMEAAAREQLTRQQLAALHANQSGHTRENVVLGHQATHGSDVTLARSGQAADSGPVAAGADTTASAASAQSGEDASPPEIPDVGAQAAATLASLESDRAAAGATAVQVQQLARLAVAAYGM